jgi:hypothetical protein
MKLFLQGCSSNASQSLHPYCCAAPGVELDKLLLLGEDFVS